MEAWSDFFVAEAGAAAALAGLLFVAVSINLSRILEFPHLPMRAIEALTCLLSVLVIATFGLVPGQSLAAYGWEFALTAVVILAIQTTAFVRTHKHVAKHVSVGIHLFLNVAPSLPFLIAGVLLVQGNPVGFYLNVVGVLLSFGAGIVGAWVLLVEIQR